jgi:hypothetical protein
VIFLLNPAQFIEQAKTAHTILGRCASVSYGVLRAHDAQSTLVTTSGVPRLTAAYGDFLPTFARGACCFSFSPTPGL